MDNKKAKAKNSKKKRKEREQSSTRSGTLGASLFGATAGLLTALISAAVCALICLSLNDPNKLTAPLGYVCAAIGYFVAGYLSVKKRGGAAIPCGALSGALLTTVFFVCSLFLSGDTASGSGILIVFFIRLSMIAVSLLGAVISAARR